MERRYRLCVVGFAHMHVNELVDRFLATGRVELVACADTVPRRPSRTTVDGSRRANLLRALGKPDAPRAYDDYRDMLQRETLDIAIFCPEIGRHAELAEALAERGLHMVTEKPMARSVADARRMLRAAERADVRLAVNWPITWRPAIREVAALVENGAIGSIRQMKWRNRASLGPLAAGSLHPGNTVVSGELSEAEKAAEWWYQAEEGGGALLDYCCYGACLAAWYLGGSPLSVQTLAANLASPFGNVEDNAVMLLRYPDATALIEASWTTVHDGIPTGPILYGSHGTIVVDGGNVLLYGGRDAAPRVSAGQPLPAGRSTIAEEFLHHIETGAPLHPTLAPALNLAATAILEAGMQAAASGSAATPGAAS
jgi:predicted dehydrogenase